MAKHRDTVQRRRLSEAIRCYRETHGISARECARQIGVNYNTLHRVERSSASVLADNFLKVLVWLLDFAHHRSTIDGVTRR